MERKRELSGIFAELDGSSGKGRNFLPEVSIIGFPPVTPEEIGSISIGVKHAISALGISAAVGQFSYQLFKYSDWLKEVSREPFAEPVDATSLDHHETLEEYWRRQGIA